MIECYNNFFKENVYKENYNNCHFIAQWKININRIYDFYFFLTPSNILISLKEIKLISLDMMDSQRVYLGSKRSFLD